MQTMEILGGVFAAFTLFMLFMRIRRRTSGRRMPPRRSPVFDLAELQSMLDAGHITPEEYERVRISLTRQLDPSDASTPATHRGFEVGPAKRPPEGTGPAAS